MQVSLSPLRTELARFAEGDSLVLSSKERTMLTLIESPLIPPLIPPLKPIDPP